MKNDNLILVSEPEHINRTSTTRTWQALHKHYDHGTSHIPQNT